MYPEQLTYTADHEWLRLVEEAGDPAVRIGITSFAQEALGDIVFVTLPAVGAQFQAGEPLGEVESTKSVSEVYAPVSGTVRARNEQLESAPELVNSDPYGEGWMVELVPLDGAAALDGPGLLDAAGYAATVGSA